MYTDTSQKILELIGKKGQITPRQIGQTVGVGQVSVHRHLKRLLDQDQIEKVGSPPKVFYQLKTHPRYGVAKKWVESLEGFELDPQVYCKTRDVFQARLEKLQSALNKVFSMDQITPLVIAVVGEIGDNSFDHNLGNWPDLMGIFFDYDEENNIITLADRGQGILKTLKRVKPELDSHAQALEVAFTETISGRYPEARGNGLKFVRSVIVNNPLSLHFQTGNACLDIKQNDINLSVHQASDVIKGCFAIIKIEKKL